MNVCQERLGTHTQRKPAPKITTLMLFVFVFVVVLFLFLSFLFSQGARALDAEGADLLREGAPQADPSLRRPGNLNVRPS